MDPQSVDRLTATEAVLAETGAAGEPLTTQEVADELSVTRRAAYERLATLADRGDVATKKVGARGRVWWRPSAAADRGPPAFTETILDAQSDLVYEYDTQRRLTRWNERVVEVTGYDPNELDGTPVEQFVPPDQRDYVVESTERLLEVNGTETLSVTIVTADGEELPYEVTGTAITDADGNVTGAAGIGRNVSERVERERQLRRERDFSDRLVESVPASILVVGRDGTIVRANERAWTRLGIDADSEATFGPTDLDVYDADGELLSPSERPVPRAFSTGEPVRDLHCQVDLPVGGMQWISASAIPLGDEEPVERVLVTARDISELKHRAEQLERERATLETELEEVFARVDDGFVALDHERRFTFANGRVAEIFDRSAEEMLGRDLLEVFPAADETGALDAYEEAMDRQTPVSLEEYFPELGVWLEMAAYPSETGLSVYIRDVTRRKEREQALQEQREHLAALSNLNAVVREINEAVLQQSTRADVERLVCERLAATDSYRFAWIGESDAASRTIEPRVEAGVDGYVEEVPLGASADADRRDPAGLAIHTGEIQVTPDVRSDPRFGPWREDADAYGYRAAAAIPLVHEDTIYGVLCVYADRAGAFTDRERAVISHLGEVVGHAIAAVERKRALMNDEVVEIELVVPLPLDPLGIDLDPDVRIPFDRTVPLSDGSYALYGTTSEAGFEGVTALAGELDHCDSATRLFADDEGVRFELRLSGPPVISTIASHGGAVEVAAVEHGDYHIVVHLPTDADVRQFVDAVRETAPGTSMVARRQVTRDRTAEAVASDLAATLTDRQRAALEASYHAGYFDWPRATDGNEVADTLDISPPTFHQHLRAAQRKLLDALLS